jgi:hypothetical protein
VQQLLQQGRTGPERVPEFQRRMASQRCL